MSPPVTAMVSAVLTTSATEIGSQSRPSSWTCSMTPTPAGTNSRERLPISTLAVAPRSSGIEPCTSSPTNSSAMPTTGPGTGICRTVTKSSPIS